MTTFLVIAIISLIIYTIFGMIFTEVFTLAPIFLSIAIICLFLALKQVLAEVRALYELLHMEIEELKEKLFPDSTEETGETDNTEEMEEATETKEPDETDE